MPRKPRLPELDERQKFVLQFCINKVESIIEEFGGTVQLKLTEPRWILNLTRRQTAGDVLIDGRMDLLLLLDGGQDTSVRRTLHVIDYKAGFLDVPHAASNLQLWCYLLSALQILDHGYDLSFRDIMQAHDVELYGHILQPFAEDPHTVVKVEPDDISGMTKELSRIVRAARKPNARRTCGVVQCRWCKAKGTDRCPESMELVTRLPIIRKKTMTPVQRSTILQQCAVAKKVIAELEKQAVQMLKQDPKCIVDWELTDPVQVNEVQDLQKAFTCLEALGVTAEEFQDCLKFSVPKVINMLQLKHEDMTRKEAQKLVQTTLKPVETTKERSGHLKYKGEH